MKRLHWAELQDQLWFPNTARNALTDYIRAVFGASQLAAQTLPYIQHVLTQTGDDEVVDLCSGSGGPWLVLCRLIRGEVPRSICLTDKFPNIQAFRRAARESFGRVRFIEHAIDVSVFPAELPGVRTLFSSFHHFRPPEARAILADAVTQQRGIAIFEQTRRSIEAIALMLATPILVLLLTPFLRPFRLSRFVWTYVVPLVPLAALIDGIVSCFRTYSVEEMRELIAGLSSGAHYRWEMGETKSGGGLLSWSYLLGYPGFGPELENAHFCVGSPRWQKRARPGGNVEQHLSHSTEV